MTHRHKGAHGGRNIPRRSLHYSFLKCVEQDVEAYYYLLFALLLSETKQQRFFSQQARVVATKYKNGGRVEYTYDTQSTFSMKIGGF